MTSLVLDRPYDPSSDVQEDGSAWPFALVVGEETILADHASDIVGHLIDGYDQYADDASGDAKALVARATEAIAISDILQAIVVHDAVSDDPRRLDNESEEILTALIGDRDVPVTNVDRWENSIPLVLVTTDYAPYTDDTPPSGNVLWIDPSDELAFLQSLANIGFIRFYIHADH